MVLKLLPLLVLIWLGINEASADCRTKPIREGYRGRDVIKSTHTVSILRCARTCKGEKDCTSINYNEKTKRCELLSGSEILIYPNEKFTFVGNGQIAEGGDGKVSCPATVNPTELPEADFDVNLIRTMATYTCKASYVRTSGIPEVQCREVWKEGSGGGSSGGVSQQWESPTIKCEVKCDDKAQPHDVSHTTVSVDSGRTVAMYTCKATYVHTQGAANVSCQDGGTSWNTATIICEAACDDIPIPPVSDASGVRNSLNTNLTYTCMSGSNPKATDTVSCRDSPKREWVPSDLFCSAIEYDA